MLAQLGSLVLRYTGQPACSALLPAVQQAFSHMHTAELATKAKQTPPYLKEVKKEQTKPAKKKVKKLDKPPRAVSAYIFFIKDQASARKGEGKASELMKVLAQEWKSMTDKQKQPYQDQAAASKAESTAAKEKAKEKALANRAPLSAYNVFCKEIAADLKVSNPSMSPVDVIKEAAARWRTLPEVEKQTRTAAAKAAKDAWLQQQATARA